MDAISLCELTKKILQPKGVYLVDPAIFVVNPSRGDLVVRIYSGVTPEYTRLDVGWSEGAIEVLPYSVRITDKKGTAHAYLKELGKLSVQVGSQLYFLAAKPGRETFHFPGMQEQLKPWLDKPLVMSYMVGPKK